MRTIKLHSVLLILGIVLIVSFLSLNCVSYRLRRGMYTSEHKRKAKGQVEFPAGGMLVFFASGWGAVGITHFVSLRLFLTLHAYITKKVLFYSVVGLF